MHWQLAISRWRPIYWSIKQIKAYYMYLGIFVSTGDREYPSNGYSWPKIVCDRLWPVDAVHDHSCLKSALVHFFSQLNAHPTYTVVYPHDCLVPGWPMHVSSNLLFTIAANRFQVFGSDNESSSHPNRSIRHVGVLLVRWCLQCNWLVAPIRQSVDPPHGRKQVLEKGDPSTSPTSTWVNIQPQGTMLRCVTC